MTKDQMLRKAEELKAKLEAGLAARVSESDFLGPLRSFASLAYHQSTPASERSSESVSAFEAGDYANRLKGLHTSAYMAHLALEELMSTGRFTYSRDTFLNPQRYSDAYQAYVEGRFGAGIRLLDNALLYIGVSVFGEPHNFGPHNADILLVQNHAQILRHALDGTRTLFKEIDDAMVKDFTEKGPERAKEYTIPDDLASLAENMATVAQRRTTI
ncbi:hypothetical protein HYY74_06540 [Candidatus Woesearchaeota archaeon]|nr:hypothetical protein [Candidatus Woesearchaeota archaeon]